jgi:hypothetical protein
MLASVDVQAPGFLPTLLCERGLTVRPRTSKCRWAPLADDGHRWTRDGGPVILQMQVGS